LKVAAALLLTLRGTPFLYYGEEIGMREGKFKKSEILDPIGRFYWPFYKGRDGCRTPMQWNASINAGFSTGKPWLPVNPDYLQRNVEVQEQDDQSLLTFYKRLLQLRKEHIALMRGDFEIATKYPRNTLIYFRCTSEEQLMVALNFDDQLKKIDLNCICAQDCELLLSSHANGKQPVHGSTYFLQGNEAVIFSLKKI